MGFPKPLLRIDHQTFVAHAAESMLSAVAHIIVVVGAHADRVRPAIPTDPRISVIDNPAYARGQLSSIKAGLRAVSREAEAVLVHLCDHPLVRPETFAAVVTEYRRSGRPIVLARHEMRRGHPVLFARETFEELQSAPEDQGARVVVNAIRERVAYVDVNDPGVILDLDTPEDLDRAGISRPPC